MLCFGSECSLHITCDLLQVLVSELEEHQVCVRVCVRVCILLVINTKPDSSEAH